MCDAETQIDASHLADEDVGMWRGPIKNQRKKELIPPCRQLTCPCKPGHHFADINDLVNPH